MDNMTVTVPHEPVWLLDRRGSSGQLFWRRDSSKVKFRCDVEILEYVKDPLENQFHPEPTFEDNRLTNIIVICATCVAAVCATVVIPWLIIGSTS